MEAIPVEVLAEILEATYLGVKQSTRGMLLLKDFLARVQWEIRFPLTVQSISRRFKRLALSLPSLWTTLSDRMALEGHRAYLQRSASKPLTVAIYCFNTKPESHLEAFLGSVLLHRRRWEALYITLRIGALANNLFESAAKGRVFPMLKSAVILGKVQTRTALRLDHHLFLSNMTAPHLTSALLQNVMPRGTILGTLTSLHIRFHGRCHHMPQLWEPLASCVVLNHLQISAEHWTRCLHDGEQEMEELPIQLQALNELVVVVDSISIRDATYIFRSFECPSLQTLSVSVLHSVDECPLEVWLDRLLAPGAVGWVKTMEELTLDLLEADLEDPAPGDRMLMHHLFGHPTFSALKHLDIRMMHLCFICLPPRPKMPVIKYIPPSLDFLDIANINAVDRDALIEVIESLCEAKSHATLRVAKQSLTFHHSSAMEAEEYVRGHCARAKADGRMTIVVTWVGRPARSFIAQGAPKHLSKRAVRETV